MVISDFIFAKNNDIVIAVVNGEFTVKRYIDLNGKICLRAETEISNYPDIEISDSIDFEIWGIVTHTIHSNR